MNSLSRFAFYLSLVGATHAATSLPTDGTVERLPEVRVNEVRSPEPLPFSPQVTESVTASRIEETINAVDTEDAVKYLPSLFLRKRNYGDTQAVMATRVWGVSSSARSLVYADGVLLSALVANNNSIGGPRWGAVVPAAIERIDVSYGPFSAAYPGNSMGAVMEITTRQPEKLEVSLTETEAWQHFNLYGTKDDTFTHQVAVNVGNRIGKFSFWVSGNYQDSHSQPLTFTTSPLFPVNTSGGYIAFNKLNQPANIVGAGGLLHTQMTTGNFKAAYDIAPWLRATYTFSVWRNEASALTQTYLRDTAGQPTFGGLAGFASGAYDLSEQHTAHSLSLKTKTQGDWDFEASASVYRMDHDKQWSPNGVASTGATFTTAGRVASLSGTGWSTLDLKATWRPNGEHTLTFGAHDDRYHLLNPTFNTPNWHIDTPSTSVATEGDGKTHTQALWIQDVWRIKPTLKLTLGSRFESWSAYDGYNVNGVVAIRQPELKTSHGSPKASLAWTPAPAWLVTASVGKAYRYATASELYQLISTGSTFTSPTPNLKPDKVIATEVAIEHSLKDGHARLSFFQDDVRDAIIAQFEPLVPNSSQLYSFLSNVDHIRARGVEVMIEQRNVFTHGLDFAANATYLDAKTLATSGQASANAPSGSTIGKRLPNIPDWRASFQINYRPDQQWSFSVAGRYSGKLYTTLDDADLNPNTYQGFSSWFVADLRAHLRINPHWSASLGLDNVLNRKYFLFHPFPQRTTVASIKYGF